MESSLSPSKKDPFFVKTKQRVSLLICMYIVVNQFLREGGPNFEGQILAEALSIQKKKKRKKWTVEICTTVATLQRQLHYSNFLSKKKIKIRLQDLR